MFFLPEARSSFISLDPHLACYLLPRILHLCDYNYSFVLCLWLFKIWTDPGTSEAKCIYQFDAWPEWLIINHPCWQLDMCCSPQGLRHKHHNTTQHLSSGGWGEKPLSAERTGKTDFTFRLYSPRQYFYLSETWHSEVLAITDGHFSMTMCAGVWHNVPLGCYPQMSNSLCSKCVLAGGKKKGYGNH